ncbi:MAG: GNAT family N-acetyltransferase [Verrucomicrobia bacterium]|nr:GNAT family N-acetyltransferase [Verrucomicrobiota bacterium]
MHFEQIHGDYQISTDPARLDVDSIHAFLSRSYWAEQIPQATVRAAIDGSLCFGVYREREQVGFARIITDYATFAYLCDVYIEPAHRNYGLSKLLVGAIQKHPRLQDLKRWCLVTRDAHGLYEQFGFRRDECGGWMEIVDLEIYKRALPRS